MELTRAGLDTGLPSCALDQETTVAALLLICFRPSLRSGVGHPCNGVSFHAAASPAFL